MADNIKQQEQQHLDGVIYKIKVAETSLEKRLNQLKKTSKTFTPTLTMMFDLKLQLTAA